MNVTVVCTGNVARSPALAMLLQKLRPDLHVTSAAVGRKAVDGRCCAKPMRQLLAEHAGLNDAASAHRSRRYDPADRPDLVICCAKVHAERLRDIDTTVPFLMCYPLIPDPAFGGPAAYIAAFPKILSNAERLAYTLGWSV